MKEYNLQEFSGHTIFWYEQDGLRYSFTADPENSDYAEYLASLEPKLPEVKETSEILVAE